MTPTISAAKQPIAARRHFLIAAPAVAALKLTKSGGCMLETAIGTAAYAQCFAAVPGITQGCELFGHLLLKDTITAQSIELRDFEVWITDGPGIGVDLDEDKLAFYRRDRH